MKLLMVSPIPTDPPTAGNRARVVSVLGALERLGHDATFAYVPYETDSADRDAMVARLGGRLAVLEAGVPPFPTLKGRLKRKISRKLRRPSMYVWELDEWFDDRLIPQVQRLQEVGGFEAVLIEYVFLSKIACVLPKSVRIVIDAHDLFGNRHEQYLQGGMQPVWYSTTIEDEVRGLNRANAVIAIQEGEADLLRRRGVRGVVCVGHFSPQDAVPLPDPGGARLLFVGSGNAINIRGLQWFVQHVLPEIRAAVPECELAIAGPAGHKCKWPEGVVVLGEVGALSDAYSGAAVVINPVQLGTGLAVKTVEALSYGKPTVATSAGARGFGPEFASAMRIAKDSESFARLTVELLRNPAERNRLSKNAVAAMQTWQALQLRALDAAITGKAVLT